MISQLTAVEDKISDANSLVKKKKKNCENENKLTDNEQINILLLQNLISLGKKFLMQDQHEQIQ